MAWRPLLSWIMSSSSSSSSSYSSSEFESDSEDDLRRHDPVNNNVQQAQKGRDVDDQEDEDDEDDFSYEPHEAEDEEEPKSSSTSDYSFTIYEPRAKRRRIDHANEALLTSVQEEKKRWGKRVWSKEDELELLRGFLDYYGTRQTKTTKATAKETASLYYEIKPRLKLECSQTKMVEKVRRLKKKYHNVVKKMNEINSSGKEFRFKNAHDNAVFELSHKIWNVENRNNCVVESQNNNVMVKREEDNVAASSSVADHERPTTSFDENNNVTNVDDNMNNGHDVRGLLVGLAMNPMPLSLRLKMGGGGGGVGEVVEDEKWRQQQILELEAYEKRLDLVQHQVKAALEELRSKGEAQ